MKVQITNEDITLGVKACPRAEGGLFEERLDMDYILTEDPMSRAMQRVEKFMDKQIKVGVATFSLWKDGHRLSTHFLPEDARQWNKSFVLNEQLNPLSFEI